MVNVYILFNYLEAVFSVLFFPINFFLMFHRAKIHDYTNTFQHQYCETVNTLGLDDIIDRYLPDRNQQRIFVTHPLQEESAESQLWLVFVSLKHNKA